MLGTRICLSPRHETLSTLPALGEVIPKGSIYHIKLQHVIRTNLTFRLAQDSNSEKDLSEVRNSSHDNYGIKRVSNAEYGWTVDLDLRTTPLWTTYGRQEYMLFVNDGTGVYGISALFLHRRRGLPAYNSCDGSAGLVGYASDH